MFAWEALEGGAIYWIWPGHVGFQTTLNEGALFGIGQGMVWLFAFVSMIAAAAIPIWLFVLQGARLWWPTLILSCIMAGVLGNLYDRLGFPGLTYQWPPQRIGEPVFAVRDWILWQYSDELRWPNFNIADSLLVLGAAMLLWNAMRSSTDTAKAGLDSLSRQTRQ
jgi:signal peptidase II